MDKKIWNGLNPFDEKRQLKAVSKWEDKDEALTEVAKEIRKAIENYKVGK